MRQVFSSMRYKMLAAYIPSIIVPILLVGMLSRGIATSVVTARARSANTLIVAQLTRHLDTIIEDIASTSILIILNRDLGFLVSTPFREKAENNVIVRNLQEFLSHLRTSKAYVYALHLEFFDGRILQTSNPTKRPPLSLFGLSASEKARTITANGAAAWDLVQSDQQGHYLLRYSRLVKDIADQVTPIAFLTLFVDTSYISSLLRDSSLLTGSTLYMVDTGDATILACSSEQRIGDVLSMPDARSRAGAPDSRAFVRSVQKLRPVGWEIVSDVPMSVIVRDNRRIDYVTLFGAFLGLAVGLLATIVLSKRILRPLENLRNSMNSFSAGNTDVEIDVRGRDEIALLGKTFNDMSRRLKEMTLEVFAAQIEKRDAEIAALNAQINPHFLFNTLDTIYWIAKLEQADEAARLTKALSALFRLSLASGDGLCPLSDELNHVKNYMIIQERRYQDKIRLRTDVDDSLLDLRVVKLVLQPLVENAIVHGLEGVDGEGTIHVRITKGEDAIVFVVEDNGRGADEASILELIAHGTGTSGFALRNIDRRIRLLGGQGFGLEFHSSPGHGARVTVRHPLL